MGCVAVKLILDLWITILYRWDMKNRKDNMNQETMIKELESKFKLNAVPMEEWDSNRDNGIWIRDDICKESTGFYNYAEDSMNDDNILNKFMLKHGWYAQPYDAETIFFYEI